MDAPSLVSAWDVLVQQLCSVFTEPTGHTWSQIASGWALNRGPATVTAIFRTLGNVADRHWTVYEKFFYRAAWCLSTLCATLLQRVVSPLLLAAAQEQAGPVVADGQYASRDGVRALPENVNLVRRLRRDAAIYALPKARRRGQRGQPAQKDPAGRRRGNWRPDAR